MTAPSDIESAPNNTEVLKSNSIDSPAKMQIWSKMKAYSISVTSQLSASTQKGHRNSYKQVNERQTRIHTGSISTVSIDVDGSLIGPPVVSNIVFECINHGLELFKLEVGVSMRVVVGCRRRCWHWNYWHRGQRRPRSGEVVVVVRLVWLRLRLVARAPWVN